MRPHAVRLAVLFALGAPLALSACGQKGPLYLPDKNATVISSGPTGPPPPPPAQPPQPAPVPEAQSSPEQDGTATPAQPSAQAPAAQSPKKPTGEDGDSRAAH